MIKGRRRNYQLGGSKAVTYPSNVLVGEEASIAGNRLLLIDPRGEISEDDLLEFMEKHVEPVFWDWWQAKKAGKAYLEGRVVVAQAAENTTGQGALAVPLAAPGSVLVQCIYCGGQMSWPVNLKWGYCYYCRRPLQVVL